MQASPLHERYATAVDRESARELLAAKLEEGARKAAEDARIKELEREQKNARVEGRSSSKGSTKRSAPKEPDSMVDSVLGSPVFKDFMRTAAREIARGMFKSGRR